MAAAEKEEEVVDLGRVREDLECPICMSFLSCPVTLGCGHNFCHRCIARHWEDARRGYQCPLCQATWPSLPQLSKNTALAALVEKIRPRSSPAAAPLLCPGAEAGALCLTCMGSCQRREGAPPSHLLVRPPNSLALAGWPCRDHARALQHFCRTHGLPVCPACAGQQQHSACQLVALLPEFRQRQEHLKTKISEMSVELKRKEDAISKKMEESSQINISLSEIRASLTQSFQDMKRIIEGQKCAALRKVEEERQRAEQEIANDIKAFTVEVTKLKDFRAKSQHTVEDDWLGLLQGKPLDEENCMMFPEQPESPAFDSKEVRALVSAVEKLKQSLLENSTLEEFPLQEQQEQPAALRQGDRGPSLFPKTPNNPAELKLQQFSQWSAHVTFDPQTINCYHRLSPEKKEVRVVAVKHNYPPTPKRFIISQVLCSQGFDHGCHYWEVSTKDSEGWAIGVTDGRIGKRDRLGRNGSSWCVEWSNKQLSAWHQTCHACPIQTKPQAVGVLLDCDKGMLTFHSADDGTVLHTFESLSLFPVFPAFWLNGLGKGASLTII